MLAPWRISAIKNFTLATALLIFCVPVWAASSTTTTLTVSPSSTVAVGTALTLKATVTSGGNPVGHGLVTFCNASAPHCEDTAVLGTASLNSSGFGTLHLTLGPGPHNITAIFRGTSSYIASISSVQPIAVTASSTTTITSLGSAGNYSLTGTVATVGPAGPTGVVSFIDSSNANFLLGSAALGTPNFQTSSLSFQETTLGSGFGNPFADPWGIAVGDFNGDGKLDFAVSNYSTTQNVVVMLGNGDGTFTLASSISMGGDVSTYIAVGDFNGDGIPDLAVGTSSSNNLRILLGNGNGTFTLKSTFTGVTQPMNVMTDDFNGDGILDLVVTSALGDVGILLGNGDGTFTLKTTLAGSYARVAAADFNGDGILDLAVLPADGSLNFTESIFLGNGDGTFTLKDTLTPDNDPISATIGDFNGDGKPDLAILCENHVDIFLGNGDGTFTQKSSLSEVGGGPLMIVAGDLNGDNKLDLAYTDWASGTVSILLGNGDGTFSASLSYATGEYPNWAVVGDLNGDGKVDIVVADSVDAGGNSVSVFLNQMSTSTTATAILLDASVPGTGTHSVLARYGGDSNYTASQSSTITLNGSAIATITTLSVSPLGSTEPSGTTLQFIASIAPSIKGGLVASGTVSFYDGGTTLLGTSDINNGQGLINISTLSVGGHTVTANYSGDVNFASSTSSALPITISSGSSSPIPTPPSNATWFYNLQDATSSGTWAPSFGASTGGSLTGSYSLTPGISSPSLSGSSMKQTSTGSGLDKNGKQSGFNVLYYKDLGCSTTPNGGTNTTGTLTITVSTPTTTSNSISISASASDTTYAVTAIQIYLDNNLVFNSATNGPITPTSYTMTGLTSGSHSVVTKAWDSHGTLSMVTSAITLGGANCGAVTNFLDDLWFYIDPSSTHLQALEFDPDLLLGGYLYSPSMQCDSASGYWRYWNAASLSWVQPLVNPQLCLLLASTGNWHHYQLYTTVNAAAHTYTYQALVVDGETVYSNPGWSPSATNCNVAGSFCNGWANNIWVQQQIDNQATAGTNTVYYDDYNYTVW